MTSKFVGILIYLLVLLGIGWFASRRVKSLGDYIAAGKRLGFLPAALSARATGESAWLLLGLTGMGAAIGLQAFWVVVGEIVGVGIAWLCMNRRFNRLTTQYGALTIPDYLEARFRDPSHALRLFSAGALVVFVMIYVSAQIDATATAFHSFLGWNYFVGATVGFSVVVIYIVAGGFLAVVWSDVFQGGLMFIGLVTIPILGLIYAGGWNNVADGLAAQDPGLMSIWGPAGLTLNNLLAIVALVSIGLGFLGSPQIFVRILALKSESEVKKGAVVAILYTTLTDCGAVLIGMIGRHLLMGPQDSLVPVLGANGQDVLPLIVEVLIPVALIGLVIAGVLSAAMSTVDSLLLVAASSVVRDVYQRILHPSLPDESLVRLSRLTTVGLAMGAFALAMTIAITIPERTVFWFIVFGWSGIAATFCPTMILSLFWARFTRRGALAAMISGFLAVPLFKFGMPLLPGAAGEAFANLGEMFPAFVVGFAVGIPVSLFDRRGQLALQDIEAELKSHSE
ncbi:MAG: sodium/proline symporter [Verrucomicrobiales bacterium]|jgi:sodium/proline symporter